MSTIYLVRHAHADWRPDESQSLSAWGRAEAERVADLLSQFPITAIYSSPARRARQTVAPLAARLGLPIQAVSDLRERLALGGAIAAPHTLPIQAVSDLRERQLYDAVVEDFSGAVKATWAAPWFAFPGGEANAAAQERGLAVVRGLLAQHPAAHLALATHGNLLALVLQHFDRSIDFAFWRSLTMPDVYRLEVSADGGASIPRLWQPAG